ncbi:Uncharacterised protein [Chryseobacterium indoltheticum]|uniref:Uncharacterized protein n=1 Tax=Chryseobacterium indoltheticum TaxID=254 RepID=A0A381FNH8_9FLAO|nr:Uncharacterised protein [Chryseobacterium indoltheticum]
MMRKKCAEFITTYKTQLINLSVIFTELKGSVTGALNQF